ncbi:MAG TPA: PQQ-binding-like beta-propeller repeat protein [Candidatus Nanopelagicaceae bacterium]|nr:PQQ-binding-like beta-propeller repeat protein [Candidatus Nanopelagicaceae bacterium]
MAHSLGTRSPHKRTALIAGICLALMGSAVQAAASNSPGGDLASAGPLTKAALARGSDPSVLPGAIAIADEGNNRIVVVDPQGRVRWIFPQKGDLKPGQVFRTPDDVFFSADGRSLIVTESENQMVSIIDIATRKISFQYGVAGKESSRKGHLANPDDAILLKDGRLLIADIKNCRLLFINPKTRKTSQLGTTRSCVHRPPRQFGSPNGAFPMKDGRYLVTEINGNWVDAMSLTGTSAGKVSWSVHPPGIAYPSDTSEVAPNVYLTVDFSKPGQIIEFNSKGKLLWRFRPTGKSALDHTSLAHALPNGDVIATDDRNHRVIVVDPKTNKIVWQYGKYRVAGKGAGRLNNPDGLDLLPPNSLLFSD